MFNIRSHVDFFSNCADIFMHQRVWQRFLCLQAWWRLAGFMYDIGTKQKGWPPQLKYFLSQFLHVLQIYKCSGVGLLWLPLLGIPITSTPHLPKIHENIWSDDVPPSHYHVLKWLTIDTFNEICVGAYVPSALLNPVFDIKLVFTKDWSLFGL